MKLTRLMAVKAARGRQLRAWPSRTGRSIEAGRPGLVSEEMS